MIAHIMFLRMFLSSHRMFFLFKYSGRIFSFLIFYAWWKIFHFFTFSQIKINNWSTLRGNLLIMTLFSYSSSRRKTFNIPNGLSIGWNLVSIFISFSLLSLLHECSCSPMSSFLVNGVWLFGFLCHLELKNYMRWNMKI